MVISLKQVYVYTPWPQSSCWVLLRWLADRIAVLDKCCHEEYSRNCFLVNSPKQAAEGGTRQIPEFVMLRQVRRLLATAEP